VNCEGGVAVNCEGVVAVNCEVGVAVNCEGDVAVNCEGGVAVNCEGKPEGNIFTQCCQKNFYDVKTEQEVLRAVVQEV
jgi:hypothetical protein